MEPSALNILSILIAFEATLFAVYIISLNVDRKISNVFISLFIFIFSLESITPLLYEVYFNSHPQFALILDTIFFNQFPLIYLYIKSASFKDFKLKKIDFLHLIPFIFINILFILNYHILPLETKTLIIESNERLLQDTIRIVYFVMAIQVILYLTLSIKEISKYKQIVNANYSDYGKNNYKWIRQLIFVFIFILVLASVKNLAGYFINEEVHDLLFVILKIAVLFFVNWLIYKALKRPYLFSGVDSHLNLMKELVKEQEAIEKSRGSELSEEEESLQKSLDTLMEEEKPYLNPSLTLHDLAMQLNTPSRELSMLINKIYKKHYFDFINSYRIDKAIEILINPENKKLTILEIMYDVGFNSKSSFNTAFKKYTKHTPSQYKNIYS